MQGRNLVPAVIRGEGVALADDVPATDPCCALAACLHSIMVESQHQVVEFWLVPDGTR